MYVKGFSENNFEKIEQLQIKWLEDAVRRERDEECKIEGKDIKSSQSSAIDSHTGRIFTNYTVWIYYTVEYKDDPKSKIMSNYQTLFDAADRLVVNINSSEQGSIPDAVDALEEALKISDGDIG